MEIMEFGGDVFDSSGGSKRWLSRWNKRGGMGDGVGDGIGDEVEEADKVRGVLEELEGTINGGSKCV